jgi:nicotinate-nucleotide adenylyltransferase
MTGLIGIFGGTFDPPHLGHLILGAEALEHFGLGRLLWVLTPQPPHKPERSITPLEQRHEMLRLALSDEPRFELSRIEIDRPGPHYTVDTLGLLQRQNPDCGLVLLLGGDSLRDLPGWKDPRKIVALCHTLGIMRRPNDEIELDALERILPGLSTKVHFMDVPLLEIASSEIRRRVNQKGSFRYYLHPNVYEYIQQNGLYR